MPAATFLWTALFALASTRSKFNDSSLFRNPSPQHVHSMQAFVRYLGPRSNIMKLSARLSLFLVAAIIAVAAAMPITLPVFAQSPAVPIVGSLAKGEWTLRFRDGSPQRRICIRSGQEIIQLRHRRSDCSRFVVDEGANRVTIQYTCPRNGYGRTSVRRETDRLIQVESQGIAGGVPFQFAAEARRTGSC